MPQKESESSNPKKITVVKEDGKFVLKDENGFVYDKSVVRTNKKEAEIAAEDWNNYYAHPVGQ